MSKKTLLLVVLFLVASVALVMAAEEKKTGEETLKCPVSGKEFTKAETTPKYEYEGKTYYFCCEGCKDAFVKEPAKYTKKDSQTDHGAESEHTCGEYHAGAPEYAHDEHANHDHHAHAEEEHKRRNHRLRMLPRFSQPRPRVGLQYMRETRRNRPQSSGSDAEEEALLQEDAEQIEESKREDKIRPKTSRLQNNSLHMLRLSGIQKRPLRQG